MHTVHVMLIQCSLDVYSTLQQLTDSAEGLIATICACVLPAFIKHMHAVLLTSGHTVLSMACTVDMTNLRGLAMYMRSHCYLARGLHLMYEIMVDCQHKLFRLTCQAKLALCSRFRNSCRMSRWGLCTTCAGIALACRTRYFAVCRLPCCTVSVGLILFLVK